jgi:hypothetical protein
MSYLSVVYKYPHSKILQILNSSAGGDIKTAEGWLGVRNVYDNWECVSIKFEHVRMLISKIYSYVSKSHTCHDTCRPRTSYYKCS